MAILDANEIEVQIYASGDGEIGRVQLVKWSDAEETLVKVLRNVQLTIKLECVRIDSWTSFKFWRACCEILTKYLEIGKNTIEENLLPQKKIPKGPQEISARGTFPLLKTFQRSRQFAFHLPRGRLPLSESEWKKRYEKRYLKAHPNKKPGRPRKDGRPAGVYKETRVKLTDAERYGFHNVYLTKAQLKNVQREKHEKTGGSGGGTTPKSERVKIKGKRGRPFVKRRVYKVRYLKTRARFKTVLIAKEKGPPKRKWKGSSKPRSTVHGRPSEAEYFIFRRWLNLNRKG